MRRKERWKKTKALLLSSRKNNFSTEKLMKAHNGVEGSKRKEKCDDVEDGIEIKEEISEETREKKASKGPPVDRNGPP
ncbi:hypothetical protein TNCT_399301 [Trichonephila clavata]|uniref:Uncharacterized protein n=1 Tax=Trichonephila clavata TaxID=2740835 RepID=A0A8X6H0J9_TRICU|nr:hypothetical protein TNCT_399301 [Trichonephila clavata]